jgi:hypothetical protein
MFFSEPRVEADYWDTSLLHHARMALTSAATGSTRLKLGLVVGKIVPAP